ncbi:SMR family transporter [Variovorax ginsengisoli]|uniref:Drug/metabolite transporter (DMT)-like permease n=1 Tax=Variovorax ginsengisoli TaxID=363844 RepID=A0ABT9SD09_9BURK|nr:SMR family transporter [Variovorax ginsengisoli]MDP9902075.1 drug/metabolite transporter (DMT)-like permease [Variovorax ginsengisoli]
MKALDFLWILSGVVLNAVAQLLLKAGAASAGQITLGAGAHALWATALGLARHPGILGGLACYVISVVVWIVALSRVEVSVAYPMLSIGYVLNALLAWWLFGETLNAQRWLGIGVIMVGVVLVARSGSNT